MPFGFRPVRPVSVSNGTQRQQTCEAARPNSKVTGAGLKELASLKQLQLLE